MEREVTEISMPESIASTSIELSVLQESLKVAQRDEFHPEGASMDQLSNVTVDGLLHSTCRNKSSSKMKTVGVECKVEVKEEESKGSSIGRGKTTKGEHNPQTDADRATMPNHFSSIHRGSGTEKYRVNVHRPLPGNGTLHPTGLSEDRVKKFLDRYNEKRDSKLKNRTYLKHSKVNQIAIEREEKSEKNLKSEIPEGKQRRHNTISQDVNEMQDKVRACYVMQL